MKRLIGLMFLLLLTVAMAGPVQRALMFALEGERLAAARYEAFAVKADEEGYHGVASLFRAEARAEQVHAGRFEAMLKERGVEVPPPNVPKLDVGSTRDNLTTAIAAEQKERDNTYRDGCDTAKKYGDTEVAELFDVTRDAEVEHFNLSTAARSDLEKMKQSKTFYVCRRCGYTTDVNLELCPSCRDQHRMDEVE